MITPNTFMTRMPFFGTNDFGNQFNRQDKQWKCDDRMEYVPNPYDFYPEFVAATDFPFNDKNVTVEVWDVTEAPLIIDTLGSELWGDYLRAYESFSFGPVSRPVIIFSGYFKEDKMVCGRLYQYRIISSGKKYYSEVWRCGDYSFLTDRKENLTRISYRSDCQRQGIWYDILPNFWQNLWLMSDGLDPVHQLEEEAMSDAVGNTTTIGSRLTKTYIISVPRMNYPMIDALNAMATYNPNAITHRRLHYNAYDPNQPQHLNVVDVTPEAPDVTLSECSPIQKLRIQVDPIIQVVSCCDNEAPVTYCGSIKPPQPTVGPGLTPTAQLKVTVPATDVLNPLPWSVGKIPRNALVQIEITRVDYPTFPVLTIDVTGSHVNSGYNTMYVPGYLHRIKYRIKSINDPYNCWSGWSNIVEYSG